MTANAVVVIYVNMATNCVAGINGLNARNKLGVIIVFVASGASSMPRGEGRGGGGKVKGVR